MAQQLLQTPSAANKTVPVSIEGTDIVFEVPVNAKPEEIIRLGQAALQRQATLERAQATGGPGIRQGEKHEAATNIALGLLPDLGALIGSTAPGGALVRAIMSILGGAGGEGVRQVTEGEDTSIPQMITSGAFQTLPPVAHGVGVGTRALGDRALRSVFRPTARHEEKFPTVNIPKEITSRRLMPDEESVAKLAREVKLARADRRAAVQGKQASTVPVMDALQNKIAQLRLSAQASGGAHGEFDQMEKLNDLLLFLQQRYPQQQMPAEALLEAKIRGGMKGSPAYDAARSGNLAGVNPEVSRTFTAGASEALENVPGVADTTRRLEVNKAIYRPVADAAHRETYRNVALWDPRMLAGAGVAGVAGALTGNPALSMVAFPMGYMAASPKGMARFGYATQGAEKIPLEEIVRAILAGGGARMDAER